MDLSALSDADLDALSKNDLSKVSDEGLDVIHAQSAPKEPEDDSLWGKVKSGARELRDATVDELPLLGGMAGGILGTPADLVAGPMGNVAGAAAGYTGGQALKNAINGYIAPEKAPHGLAETAESLGTAPLKGAALEVGGQAVNKAIGAGAGLVAPYVKPYLNEAGELIVGGMNRMGKYVGDKAEKLALRATGATGAQASRFAPGTGRALLDNGIVKFGRTPEGVADAASAALDETGTKIGGIVDDISAKNSENLAKLQAERSRLESLIEGEESKASTGASSARPPPPEPPTASGGREIDLRAKKQMVPTLAPEEPTWETGGDGLSADLGKTFDANKSTAQLAGESEGSRLSGLLDASRPPVPPPELSVALPSGQGSAEYLAALKSQLEDVNYAINSTPGNKGDLMAALQRKINELGSDPAQAQVVRQLEAIKESVSNGPQLPTMRQLEDTKAGFQGMVNWANPEGNAAKAAAADVYRQAGESVAKGAGPEAAKSFTDAKALYGQLKPVAAAAERRASTLNQSPPGGLLDVASAGAGAAVAGAPGAVITPVARRVLAPRAASSMASAANSLSQVLQKSPGAFGKFAPALQSAAVRGETALAARSYILQQTQPEYREVLKKVAGQGDGGSQ